MTKHISLRFYLFLVISDQIAVIASLFLATLLRTTVNLGIPQSYNQVQLPIVIYVTASLLLLIAFLIIDVYGPRNTITLTRELQTLTTASFAGWMLLAGFLYFTYRNVSRLQVVYCFIIFLCFLYIHRVSIRLIFTLQNGRRFHIHPVLIIGGGAIAARVKEQIDKQNWTGLRLVGTICDEHEQALTTIPWLGSLDRALTVINEYEIEEVIFATDPRQNRQARDLISDLQALPVNTRVVPDYFDLAFLLLRIEDLGGIPLLSLREPALTSLQRLVKRGFDLILVFILLFPSLLLMALLAIAIRLDSVGPAIFVQERVGEKQRTFRMYKFRSMVDDAEERQQKLFAEDNNGSLVHKSPNDPRITRVGRFLRRTSLDELPQLINVLRGEMSFVGPRPEMTWMVDRYEPWQRKRFEVPQGMTGWWQINGRAERLMHEHIDDDLYYIRNYSLWLDLLILWRTVGVVLSGRGAY